MLLAEEDLAAMRPALAVAPELVVQTLARARKRRARKSAKKKVKKAVKSSAKKDTEIGSKKGTEARSEEESCQKGEAKITVPP